MQPLKTAARLSLPALLLGPLVPTTPAQQLQSGVGGTAGARFGSAAVPFRDWDGDGYIDLLVGEPGPATAPGRIRLVSGFYLGTAQGQDVLATWAADPSLQQPGDGFGSAIAVCGDFDGDGIDDVLVAAPGYDNPFALDGIGTDAGQISFMSGATMATPNYFPGDLSGRRMGQVWATPDVTGDGVKEIVIAALGTAPTVGGAVVVLDGVRDPVTNSFPWLGQTTGVWGYGSSLASFDHGSDGIVDLVVGSPHEFVAGVGSETGRALVVPAQGFGVAPLAWFSGTAAGEHFGSSVAVGEDYDGDGVQDLLVGSPDWIGPSGLEEGRAQVLSGASASPGGPGVVLREHLGGVTPGVSPPSGWRLGTAVCATADLNGDGRGDYLIGAPDYDYGFPLGPDQGAVQVHSGATGQQLARVVGLYDGDGIGDGLPGAFSDYDGDGFPEFSVAGSSSDLSGVDAGLINTYRLFPLAPEIYCAAKTNSLGCVPSVGWGGKPSASSPFTFTAVCNDVLNNKLGLLFYGFAPTAKPFQGGTKCVASPIKRLPTQDSGGSPAGSDCSGSYAFELNGLIQSGSSPALVAGAEVYCQFWSRDPLSSFGSSLSDGLQFVINP